MSVTDDPIRVKGSEDDCLWSVVEAARFLNLSTGTMYHLVSERRVPVIKLSARCIRFRRSELESWIATLSVPGESCGSVQSQHRKKGNS